MCGPLYVLYRIDGLPEKKDTFKIISPLSGALKRQIFLVAGCNEKINAKILNKILKK